MRGHKDAHGWWAIPRGPDNTIEDVAGVRVGHFTHLDGTARTGVTAILPHDGNLYAEPVPAGAAVLNGFGKSTGLVQLMELGEIETPVLLTNTFAVPACASALIRQAIAANPRIGRGDRTVNPLVMECNDGCMNDIQALAVTEEMAREAISNAAEPGMAQGTVGAGTGMKSFGFSGGIGSASRMVALEGGSRYTLGALVLSNFGQASEFRLFGQRLSPVSPTEGDMPDKGSIIIIFATDAPLDSRQLSRVARRAGAALGRLGSYLGHQSGDIALAFSTARARETQNGGDIAIRETLHEDRLNGFFHAAVEATEEAVLNALWQAGEIVGYNGKMLPTLRQKLAQQSSGGDIDI